MNPEKQRIAIAEACGWEWRTYGDSMAWYFKGTLRWCRDVCGLRLSQEVIPLPDYLNDLNAMHEAEKTLPPEKRQEYVQKLFSISRSWTALAPCEQRAEAFLRTIGKWEEGE